MIHNYVIIAIAVAFSVMMLVLLGQKLKVAYPIFLVISGLIISLVPGMPVFQIHPDIVFLIFLPPILFEAAWFTSWKDFWKNRKQISSMAFGLVFITSLVVAYVSSSIIPGLTLAMGFLLGGVNSPPDAVAATSILKNLKIPQKTTTVLEGESLLNDASSLIVFKFALAAVMTGQFIFKEAVGDFFIMAVMGILIGLGIGYLFSALLRIVPSNSNTDTIITLIVPYVMYISAEHFHYSGVLSVVAGGLMMSYHSHCFLSHTARLQAGSVWNTLVFAINASVFILIGLELPVVVQDMTDYTLAEGIKYALLIGGAMIGVRLLYSYALAYLPGICFKRIRLKQPKANWKEPFVISFAAMRGVVSLAAAMSIPLDMPKRNIILFVTFVIILITLLGQGLLLPYVLKWLNIEDDEEGIPHEKQEALIQHKLKQVALEKLNQEFGEDVQGNSLIRHQKTKLESELKLLTDKFSCIDQSEHFRSVAARSREVYHEILKSQRQELYTLRRAKIYDDAVLRKTEMQLDFDETKLTGFQH
ncbi:Na+/H+ antiporter [Marinilongibacter aquaticus]|uniref:Na+/H+ antiporter n=1 Tax=Marinilongibacter aquaticus TaxID=2975157 RepID=UPI0021BDCF89|nr:Na+/H+ antiporter [Marinilongibacter aquaticus]UBM58575.1 Na+/H+ antiporter [Marinilongibacter aquaticus]